MFSAGKLLNPTIDFLCPGPSSGLNGGLRKQILELEVKKRDYKLQKLFELHERSSRGHDWVGLGTIAYEIVLHFKPRKIVELGCARGFSTFSMGLALRDLGTGGRIFAVDTWEGDYQYGYYGENVYEGFLESRRILDLEETVCPMKMTFEHASKLIVPPIDLLHVDGLHTFRAVRRDFKLFRHHLAPGAIVLFHDVYTVFPQMRLFWALISRRYSSCLIPYQHGLGVIQI
jgi:methyltransferase family protein